MKFTRYFSGVIKNNGIPNIAVSEYQKVFNIVSLENRIDELYRLKDKERNQDRKYRFDIRIKHLEDQLNRLTMENTPQNILKYMLNKSMYDD
jgi:hypothetical protein